MKEIKITVGLFTYNSAPFLTEAIESVIPQSSDEIELVVVDDGSTDNTRDILNRYKAYPWFRAHRFEKNKGRSHARNKIIKEAAGAYILWMAADDLLDKNIISNYMTILQKHPETDVVYGKIQAFDDATKNKLMVYDPKDWTTSNRGLLNSLFEGTGITDGGSLVRKSLYKTYGPYDPEYYRAQDFEFWSRIAPHAKFYKFDDIIYHYRHHTTNVSAGKIIDLSYDGMALRRILGSYSREEIFPDLDWNNRARARAEAELRVLLNLYRVEDFYTVVQLTEFLDPEGANNQIQYVKFMALFRMSEWEKAGNLLVFVPRVEERNKFHKYRELCNQMDEYITSEDWDQVKKTVQAAYDMDPFHTYKSALALFQLNLHSGNQKEAEKWWITAIRIHPALSLPSGLSKQWQKSAEDTRYRAMEYKPVDFETRQTGKNRALPLVSVVIPTHDRPERLKAAVQSVLNQSFRDFEVIVVNDGGEDVEQVLSSLNEPEKIRYLRQAENQGPSAARNAAIREARGTYIALLDDDDEFYEHHLETALEYVSEDIPVIYTDSVRATYHRKGAAYELVDKRIPYSIDYDRNKLLIGNISPINCFVFSRDLAMKAGLFDESLQTLEDWDLWIRLSKFTDFKHIAKPTVQVNWRTDGTTLTTSRQNDFQVNRDRIYQKNMDDIRTIPNVQEILDAFKEIWQNDGKKITDSQSLSSVDHDQNDAVKIPQDTAPPSLVSIIMLTRNALKFTKECVSSIQKHTTYPYEIIFVDNGSTDGTKPYLREMVKNNKHFSLISNKNNKGFAGGNNQGAKKAKGDYLLLLNNDVHVSDQWLESMVHALEMDEKIGMVGPLTNSISGRQCVANVPYKDLTGFHKYAAQVRQYNNGKITPRRRLAGFAVLIRKTVYQEVGGLDTTFGIGNFEDDDLSLKIRLAGFALMVDEAIFIHHYGSQSFIANKEDYMKSLEDREGIFREKWPDVDYEELLELKNPLDQLLAAQVSEANALFSADQMDEAEALYRNILDTDPVHADAMLGLAFIAKNRNDQQSCLNYLYKMNRLCPDSPVAYNELGVMALEMGDAEGAKQFFITAVQKDPEFLDAQRNYADVLISLEDYENGVKALDQILKNHPDDLPTLLYMAHLNLEIERYENALEFLQRIKTIDPDNGTANQLLEIIETAVSGKPAGTAGRAPAGISLDEANKKLAEGDIAGAEKQYQWIYDNKRDIHALFGLALCARAKEEYTKAISFLNRIVKQHPEYALAYNELGLISMQMGDIEGSKTFLIRAIECDPEMIDAQRNYGDALISNEQYEDGVKVFEKILQNHPDDIPTLLYMAQLNFEIQRFDQTAILVNRILEIDPDNKIAPKLLELIEQSLQTEEHKTNETDMEKLHQEAQEMLEGGDTDGALAAYSALLEQFPEDVTAMYGLALTHLLKEDNAEAYQTFERLTRNAPEFPEGYYHLGVLASTRDESDKAIEYLTKTLELDGSHKNAKIALSEILIQQQQFEEGVQLLNTVLHEDPQDVNALSRMGQLYFEIDRLDEARLYFQRVLEIDPENEFVTIMMNEINQ